MQLTKIVRVMGGRKLLLGLLVIGIGIAVDLMFGLSSNLLTLLIFTAGGFFLGNVGEHVCDTLKETSYNKASTVGIPYTEVLETVNAIQGRLTNINAIENEVVQKVEVLAQATQRNVEAVSAMLNVMKATR